MQDAMTPEDSTGFHGGNDMQLLDITIEKTPVKSRLQLQTNITACRVKKLHIARLPGRLLVYAGRTYMRQY